MNTTNTFARILQEKIDKIDDLYQQIAELKHCIQNLQEWVITSDESESSSSDESESSSSENDPQEEQMDDEL